jgi:tetratricopeptide (TPR) repeat protein
MNDTPDPREAVAREVARILQSPEFQRSQTLSALLSFLRDRYPQRLTEQTTEYVIAQDLLRRGAGFDPKDDTSVRVQIRRLRVALHRYYAQNTGPQQISIPPRSYDLELTFAPATKSKVPRFFPLAAGSLLVVCGVLIWAYAWHHDAATMDLPYPHVLIMPVDNVTGDPAQHFFADGIQRQLAADLKKFGQLRVAIAPQSGLPDTDVFVIRSALIGLETNMDLSVTLEHSSEPNTPLLASRVNSPILGGDYFRVMSQVSLQISAEVGGRTGAVSQFLRARRDADAEVFLRDGIRLSLFHCIILTNLFLDDYDVSLFGKAHDCFRKNLSTIENDPVAASSFGTLLYHAVREFQLLDTTALPPEAIWTGAQLLAYAERIVARFPDAAEPFLVLGSVQNSMGLKAEAEVSLRQATDRNPGDATAFAVLAYLYLSQERFEEAVSFANEAIELSADPQAFVYFPLLFSALAIDDQTLARDSALSYLNGRTGGAALAVKLLLARLNGDAAAEADLSDAVSLLPKPVTGISEFLEGEKLKAVLHRWLPELLVNGSKIE